MSISVLQTLNRHLADAFEKSGFERKYGLVQVSDKSASFQCNGALAVAKQAKKPPREIAQNILAHLQGNTDIELAEIAGPGFINLEPSDELLKTRANFLARDNKTGAEKNQKSEKIIIDFGGPNVAKPMHVGHLRSSVIGDCLQRILRFTGHEVISDIHLGDWGLQMGHLITELQYEQPDLPYFDENKTSDFPKTSPVTIEDLARLYPQASHKAKTDAKRMELSRKATSELQKGRAGYRALLQHFINVSIEALKKDFAALGVHFDLWKGEASVDPLIPSMIEDFKRAGHTEESEGALIIRVARDDDKKETPPLILVSSAGAVLYATTDLATIMDRRNEYNPDRILYVVDMGQSNHFEQVFRAADKTGLFDYDRLEHIKFGTVNGKDGKRFRTREGGAMRLSDLLSQAKQAAQTRLEEAGLGHDMPSDELLEVARKVGLAAIKFADLQNTRTTNYIFDLDRFTSFEGKTGPYLLYAAVRIKSLLRKAGDKNVIAGEIIPKHASEKKLVLALDDFGRALRGAEAKRMPHILCEHLYGLAQEFSRFYTDCPILKPDIDEKTKASRLALAELALRQLELGLGLLGIETPERM